MMKDRENFVMVTFDSIDPVDCKFTEIKQWIESVFSAVDVQKGSSGRIYACVPIPKFIEMYPDSNVAKEGVPTFKAFAVPIPLTGLVNGIRTRAYPVYA